MQSKKYMHTWHPILFDCMHRFGIDMTEKDYWFCLLVLLPQLKITHGPNWRNVVRHLVSNDDILDAVHVGYDPDVSIYASCFTPAVV
jgi:hypothetical protein